MQGMLYRLARAFMHIILFIFYRVKPLGGENLPKKGGVILAANHQSFFDPIVVGCAARGDVTFLARRTLFKNKFFGLLLRHLKTYPIERDRTDLRAIKAAIKRLKNGDIILIFPEGTRSYDGKLQPVKHGFSMLAVRAEVPIVPVYVRGTFDIWPRTRRFPSLFGRITCRFGTPIDPAGFTSVSRKDTEKNITAAVEAALKELERAAFSK